MFYRCKSIVLPLQTYRFIVAFYCFTVVGVNLETGLSVHLLWLPGVADGELTELTGSKVAWILAVCESFVVLGALVVEDTLSTFGESGPVK